MVLILLLNLIVWPTTPLFRHELLLFHGIETAATGLDGKEWTEKRLLVVAKRMRQHH